MALPQMSDEQRAQALKKAAETRTRRKEWKAKFKDGSCTAAKAFENLDDSALSKMRVKQFVTSFSGWGPKGTEKMLDELGIDSAKRLGGLGSRQKEALIERIDKK